MTKKNKKDARDLWRALFPLECDKFLDVGCADGRETACLVGKGKEVIGIEPFEEDARKAEKRLSNVFIGKAEEINLPFEEGYFDCLIYGGVLNAFYNPLKTLRQHARYLKDGGYIILNVANVRYYKVIGMLLFKGVWDVMPHGILLKYFVRHYTLRNLEELLAEAGYEIVAVERFVRGSKLLYAVLPKAMKDIFTYEYYIKGVKKDTTQLVQQLNLRQRHCF